MEKGIPARLTAGSRSTNGDTYEPDSAVRGDRWEDAESYERFMGRWSRTLAVAFVDWLQAPGGAHWLEIGCGTGSLTRAILDRAEPKSLLACDTARDFVDFCAANLHSTGLSTAVMEPGSMPARKGGFDVVASSLVLNFLPDPALSLSQMREACAPGGLVGACVWDYAEGMEFLRCFWDAAAAADPDAGERDEGKRFPICRPQPLRETFSAAGLGEVGIGSVTIPTVFESFEDYWESFVGGPGPAPTYLASLSASGRQKLVSHLRDRLPRAADGSIPLRARAWTARGRRSAV